MDSIPALLGMGAGALFPGDQNPIVKIVVGAAIGWTLQHLPSVSTVMKLMVPKQNAVFINERGPIYEALETYVIDKYQQNIRTCRLEPRQGEVKCTLSNVEFMKGVFDTFENEQIELYIVDPKGKCETGNKLRAMFMSYVPYMAPSDGGSISDSNSPHNNSLQSRMIVVSSSKLTVRQLRKYIEGVCKYTSANEAAITKMYISSSEEKEGKNGKISTNAKWELVHVKTNKRLSNTILSRKVEDELVKDIKLFFDSEQWYNARGVPYKRGYILTGVPGSGKCLGLNTPIIMIDGSIKMVQDIKVGEILMGDDSTPRNVLSTINGKDIMYEVEQGYGDNYIVNEAHILSLKLSKSPQIQHRDSRKSYKLSWYDDRKLKSKSFSYRNQDLSMVLKNVKEFASVLPIRGNVIDISIAEYLQTTSSWKKAYKGFKTGVDYSEIGDDLLIDPYVLGCWLGDGTSSKPEITTCDKEILDAFTNAYPNLNPRVDAAGITYHMSCGKKKGHNPLLISLQSLKLINNKHIPDVYLYNSREVRKALLAGLIDTDGYLNVNACYEIIQKNKVLSSQIVKLSRSLGYRATIKEVVKSCTYKGEKRSGKYMRMYISGVDDLPVRLERKRSRPTRTDKSPLVYNINVSQLKKDKYYGFEIDGNGRFLLGDFTVTHNTSVIKSVAAEYNLPVFIIDFQVVTTNSEFSRLMKEISYYTSNSPYILAFEDLDRSSIFDRYGGNGRINIQCLLNEIDGLVETHGRLLFITANDDSVFKEVSENALVRPGRIDRTVNIGVCDFDQVQRLLFHFFGLHESIEDLQEKDMGGPYAPAQIIEIIQSHMKDEGPEQVIGKLFKRKIANDNGESVVHNPVSSVHVPGASYNTNEEKRYVRTRRQLTNIQKDKKKMESQIQQLEKDIKQLPEERKKCQKKIQVYRAKLEAAKQKVDKCQKTLQSSKEGLKKKNLKVPQMPAPSKGGRGCKRRVSRRRRGL